MIMTSVTRLAIGMLLTAACVTSCKSSGDDIDNLGAEGGKRAPKQLLAVRDLARAASRVSRDSSKLPVGTAKVLPSAPEQVAGMKGCCGGQSDGKRLDNKCSVTREWGADPVWKALDFHVDEPSEFRYAYESTDGTSFTARVTADLDCDNEEAVYTVTGKLENGKLTLTLAKPAPNVY
jgi:hypothetical protein